MSMRNGIRIILLLLLISVEGSWGGEGQNGGSEDKDENIRSPQTEELVPLKKEDPVAPKEAERPLPGGGVSSGVRLPISIDSKEMTVRAEEGRVLFKGAVRILHGDVAMKAEQAEILLRDTQQNLPNENTSPFMKGKEIAKIEVVRNVELTQGNRRVSAQRGVYDVRQQELVFSGSPEMWEDGYSIKGRVIILSLAQKRSIIEGSQLTID